MNKFTLAVLLSVVASSAFATNNTPTTGNQSFSGQQTSVIHNSTNIDSTIKNNVSSASESSSNSYSDSYTSSDSQNNQNASSYSEGSNATGGDSSAGATANGNGNSTGNTMSYTGGSTNIRYVRNAPMAYAPQAVTTPGGKVYSFGLSSPLGGVSVGVPTDMNDDDKALYEAQVAKALGLPDQVVCARAAMNQEMAKAFKAVGYSCERVQQVRYIVRTPALDAYKPAK